MENNQLVPVVQKQTKHLSFFQKAAAVPLLLAVVTPAFAAIPEIDIGDILLYIAALVAAVATVGAAILMVYLTAKGIKAIRAAF